MTPASPNPHTVSPAASPEETAAIAAALETFARATAPTVSAPVQPREPWRDAAILEGISREPQDDVPHPWINT
ncbi:MAG TPA: hypothetical protein VFY36_04775 [Solirubrobacteraceae bacterium]|nr:hypothetical protein [Solirubrobacteraceae bacterium]